MFFLDSYFAFVSSLYQGFCTKFGGFGILWFYSHKIIAKMESYAMPKDEIYLGDLSWDCLWFLNGFARIETKQKQIQIKFASQ